MSEATSQFSGERRAERRVRVRLPVEVQGVDRSGARFQERTSSEDVCRGGVAISLMHEVDLDTEIELSIPLPRQGQREETDFSTRGRVRHIETGGAGHTGTVVGVQFTGPRFHHVFVSESA